MNIFGKPIDQLVASDIQGLIDAGVSEHLHIDYKRALPDLRIPDAKASLLDDLAAFANGAGGIIVFGIRERDGVPDEIVGVDTDLDALVLRIEEIARAHIRPRIPLFHFTSVEICGKKVFVIYIRRSWRTPHMVSFPPERHRFLVRTAAGNHQMDVEDLRSAFLGGDEVERRLADFRSERVSRILSGSTPFRLVERGHAVFSGLLTGATLALHVVPFSAFEKVSRIEVTKLREVSLELVSLHFNGQARFNLDGYAMAQGQDDSNLAYAQLFTTGAVEFVTRYIAFDENSRSTIYPLELEGCSIEWLRFSLGALERLEVEPPLAIFLSLLGGAGHQMGVSRDRTRMFPEMNRRMMDRNDLLLDAVVIDAFDSDTNPEKIVHVPINRIWQAAGWEKSPNFSANGEWDRNRAQRG